MADQPRSWSLAAAREIAVEVRRITAGVVAEVEALEAQREQLASDAARRTALEQELARAVGGWVRAMEALGVEVKGRWLVDFDNGEGYYCWCYPESTVEHYHSYDEGFSGRVRIH